MSLNLQMDKVELSVRDLQNSRTQVNYLHAGVKNEGEQVRIVFTCVQVISG